MEPESQSVNPAAVEPMSYSFSHAFEQGWELLTKRYGMLLAVTSMWLILNLAVQTAQFFMQQASNSQAFTMLVVAPFSLFLLIPLQASVSWAAVAAARGQPATARTLFRGFERYWPTVGVTFVIWLVSCIVAIPIVAIFLLLAVLGPLGIFFVVLLSIPAAVVYMWIAARVMLAYVIVLDPDLGNLGPIQSLGAAFRLTEGLRGWSLTGVSLVAGVIVTLSILLFVLPGIFFGGPFWVAIMAMAYEQLVADAGLRSTSRCRFCGHQLSWVNGDTCPECGAPTEPPARRN